MKEKYKVTLYLLVILFLGFFLRFYRLGQTDIGFFRDEAALGYNSWAIWQSGRDEFGQFLPLFFRSFEVFFMPAYLYLSAPLVGLLGLTVFSTRVLSAFSGALLIPVAYFLAKEIFGREKTSLAAALVVAISPWSIFYSRGAFEGNLALLFFALGFWFWLKFLKKRAKKSFFACLFLFVCSMYSYQATRLVVPLFVAVLVILTRGWFRQIKLWFLGAVLALVFYSPVVFRMFSPASYHRSVGVSLFADKRTVGDYFSLPKEFLSLYFHYFSPSNLFVNPDYNPQRRVPNYSVFYLWMSIPLALGLVILVRRKIKYKKELVVWLLLTPLPAAFTRDPFHTYRAILFWLPLSLLVARGIDWLLAYFQEYRKASLSILLVFCFYSLSSFFFNYFKIAPVLLSPEWDYGYRELVQFIKNQPSDLRIVVDDPYTEAYIHFLYWGAIDLETYQKEAGKTVAGNYYTSAQELRPAKVGRLEFRPVDWPTERGDKGTLFVFPSRRLLPSEWAGDPKLKLVKTFYYPNGKESFFLVQNIE